MSLHRQNNSSTFELNPTIQCNDLKAFERRLMETILQQKPRERLWRILLTISLTSTATSSYFWLQDSMKAESTLLESLTTHYIFSINCVILIVLFMFGVHKRVIQSNIIVNRIRQVVYDFALTCDDNGKLIIKQNVQPNNSNSSNNDINSLASSSTTTLSSTSSLSSSSSTRRTYSYPFTY